MLKNPFHYTGALDPITQKDVLVSRSDQLNKVANGIKQGNYWIILGSRGIGRTTFLRQIARKFKNEYHIFFNMQVPQKSNETFYQWMIEQYTEQISEQKNNYKWDKGNIEDPGSRFIDFLVNLKLEEDKKIILLFDEIEGIPSIKDFFKVWKTINDDRRHKEVLNRYSLIIAGTADLIKQAAPFNIAQILYMRDFSYMECEKLINRIFKRKKITITPNAQTNLIEKISGYPQIFQHACSILIDKIAADKKIEKMDIDNVFNTLLTENSLITILKENISTDPDLRELVIRILKGDKCQFHLHKHYSIAGAGCIVEGKDSNCSIRNRLYKQLFYDFLGIEDKDNTDTVETLIHEAKNANNDPEEKYQVIETIGKGGMGKVIKAADLILNRPVAIKILKKKLFKKRNILERFKKEACLLAQFSHPNIVTIFEFIVKADDYQMVMEFIDGKNLKDMITSGGPFTGLQLVYIAKKISEAAAHLHKHKIIHRDIKPKNIMLTREGKIKIVDFGVAVIQEGKPTGETGIIMGTPQYMAPEQFTGEPPHFLSDIYSIGITLFHLATGKVPFDGQEMEDIRALQIKKPLPPITEYRKDLEKDIEGIIKKCTEKEPDKRFQSARELLEILNSKWESLDEAAIEKELIKRIGE